jgi:drug/metabolite transporter (DMT)-like permease
MIADSVRAAEHRHRIQAELGLLVMVLIWGLNFSVVKSALLAFEPLGFNSLRHLLASAFMLIVLLSQDGIGRPRRRDLPRIFVLGLVGNLAYQMAFIFGLDRTTAGNASLMLALVPIFLLIFAAATRGAPRSSWFGAGISVAGVALVSGSALRLEGAGTLIGDGLMIFAALMWAIYTVGAQPLIERYGPIRTTAWTLWVGSFFLFLAGVPSLLRQNWSVVGVTAWGGLLFSSVLSVGVAYLLWYWGVQQLGGARTAVYSNLQPIVALAAGALLLGEQLTIFSLVGAALVVGGVLLVRTKAVVT